MMNQQVNMANMNAAGGPGAGTPLVNNGGQRGGTDGQRTLNTYIYDYLLKNHYWDLARQLQAELPVITQPHTKRSPGRRDVNGVDDAMDTDGKDNINKRPDDLPDASIMQTGADNSFLYDWWCQFWDVFQAHREKHKSNAPVSQYLQHNMQQARMRQASQQRMLQQLDPTMSNNMQYRNMMQGMQANGMAMPNDLQKRAIQNNNRNANPQQLAQQMKMQQAHMMQTQMQRDGSNMDMQRPQSPGSGDNAPSPKRPRLDGNAFNGQMGPAGRGQGMQGHQVGNMVGAAGPNGQMLLQNGINPNELPQQQLNAFQASAPNVQAKQLEVYTQELAQHQRSAMINQNLAKGMNPSGLPQGSPMAHQQQNPDGSIDFFAGNRMPGGPQQQSQGNHALQDYQMQLMLLEQQNKKRLLMARQEQDSITHGPHGAGPVVQPGFAPAMSPSGSRAGPSPNPNEQMKRGTPKMGQTGLPGSPMPDMSQNRGSPIPNFPGDPSQMGPGMPPQYYTQMPANNMMRPPSSHPAFSMTPQQMETFARQNGGRMPNGAIWPQAQGPPQMMPQNPGQQPVPMGTPQQRHNNMPPPPAPPAGAEAGRTQPSSPSQQSNAPPTPSQTSKPAPKGKKEKQENRKKPPKKGSTATGATPAADAEPPPTPTPSTPITPMHPQSFNKNGASQPNAQPAPPAPAPAAPPVAPPGPDANATAPFGDLTGDPNFSLDFANPFDGPDVLESFDFDSFLHTDDGSGGLQFDPATFAFPGNEVEAGTGDV